MCACTLFQFTKFWWQLVFDIFAKDKNPCETTVVSNGGMQVFCLQISIFKSSRHLGIFLFHWFQMGQIAVLTELLRNYTSWRVHSDYLISRITPFHPWLNGIENDIHDKKEAKRSWKFLGSRGLNNVDFKVVKNQTEQFDPHQKGRNS